MLELRKQSENSLITLYCFVDYVFICYILHNVPNDFTGKVIHYKKYFILLLFILISPCCWCHDSTVLAMISMLRNYVTLISLCCWRHDTTCNDMGVTQLCDYRIHDRDIFSRDELTINTVASSGCAYSEVFCVEIWKRQTLVSRFEKVLVLCWENLEVFVIKISESGNIASLIIQLRHFWRKLFCARYYWPGVFGRCALTFL